MILITQIMRDKLIANAASSRTNGETADQAVCKLFDPTGRYTLYAFDAEEYTTIDEKSDLSIFGFCVSPLGEDCDEWGSVALSELQELKGRFGLGIERDLHFEGVSLAQIKEGLRP